MDINKLLKPNSIAIVGMSEDKGYGKSLYQNMLNLGQNVENVYFVNPKKDKIFDKKCFKKIYDIGIDIDLAIICSNKNTIIQILNDGKKCNLKSAVIYASGFSETGKIEDKVFEEDLVKTAKELDIALLGPNCAGFVNFVNNIEAFGFLTEKRERKGNVAFVSHSGQFCLSMMDDNRMKMSYDISCGNGSVVSMEDLLLYLVEDENTKVISAYVEAINDNTKFEDFLNTAKKNNKHVVLLKSGKSNESISISKKHTTNVDGENGLNNFFSICEEYGAIVVDDFEELLCAVNLLSTIKFLPKTDNVCSINMSGGVACLMSDVGKKYNIRYEQFNEEITNYLKSQMPEYASVNNPLDMTITMAYDTEHFKKVLEMILKDDSIGIIVIGYTLLLKIDDECIYHLYSALKDIYDEEKMTKPICFIPIFSCTRNYEYQEKLRELNIPILSTPVYAFSVIKKIFKSL